MKIFIIALSLGIIITSCKKQNVVESVSDQKLWVSHFYTGGIQCDTNRYHPPDIKLVLEVAGITVYDTRIEGYGVCTACGCPQYAAMHYALIDSINLSKAESMDFSKNSPSQ
jgi:hypothetical protein